MDRITKSLLDEFIQRNSLNSLLEETAFEHFSGYLVTSKHFTESFDTYHIAVGAGGDCGIDSISIIANGCLITEPFTAKVVEVTTKQIAEKEQEMPPI